MNSRQRITALIAREHADHTGFWLGNPDPATWPILHDYFGSETEEDLRKLLKDDFRWIAPGVHTSVYEHPRKKYLFDMEFEKTSHGQAGPSADCEDPKAVEDYEWPSLEHLNLQSTIDKLRSNQDSYRASGFGQHFIITLWTFLGWRITW